MVGGLGLIVEFKIGHANSRNHQDLNPSLNKDQNSEVPQTSFAEISQVRAMNPSGQWESQ